MGQGLVRDHDGLLVWHGGRHYADPGEAVKTWWAGKTRIGCAESVFANWSSSPCGNVPKHDPDANGNPTRCGVHCASAKAKRKAASDARYEAHKAKWTNQRALAEAERGLEASLRRIAEGHNDPRSLAQEVLAELDVCKQRNKK